MEGICQFRDVAMAAGPHLQRPLQDQYWALESDAVFESLQASRHS